MKNLPIVLTLIFSSLILACTNDFENKIDFINAVDKLEFESIHIKKFPTNGRLTNLINSINYKDGEVSFLNSSYNELFIFDYQKEELIEKIKFEEEGPDGISSLGLVSSHSIINSDSIIIYNMNLGYLFLVNRNAKLLKKISLADYKDPDNLYAPFPNTVRPMQYINGKVFLATGLNRRASNYSKHPSTVVVDINNSMISFKTVFPPIYNQAYWANSFKYDPAVGILNDKLIINYPVDFNLHVYEIENFEEPEVVQFGSKYFNEIPPLNFDMKYYEKKKYQEEGDYSLSTSDFAGLLIDPYKKYVLRIAYIRPSFFQVQEGNKIPDFSIIVSDSDLNRLGELRLDGNMYDCTNIFITEEGLNISRKDTNQEEESFLTFETFKYNLIE